MNGMPQPNLQHPLSILPPPPVIPPSQNWNYTGYYQAPPLRNVIKSETVDSVVPEDQKMVGAQGKKRPNVRQENDNMKNKQSANVQVYRTPFAERVCFFFQKNQNYFQKKRFILVEQWRFIFKIVAPIIPTNG